MGPGGSLRAGAKADGASGPPLGVERLGSLRGLLCHGPSAALVATWLRAPHGCCPRRGLPSRGQDPRPSEPAECDPGEPGNLLSRGPNLSLEATGREGGREAGARHLRPRRPRSSDPAPCPWHGSRPAACPPPPSASSSPAAPAPTCLGGRARPAGEPPPCPAQTAQRLRQNRPRAPPGCSSPPGRPKLLLTWGTHQLPPVPTIPFLPASLRRPPRFSGFSSNVTSPWRPFPPPPPHLLSSPRCLQLLSVMYVPSPNERRWCLAHSRRSRRGVAPVTRSLSVPLPLAPQEQWAPGGRSFPSLLPARPLG